MKRPLYNAHTNLYQCKWVHTLHTKAFDAYFSYHPGANKKANFVDILPPENWFWEETTLGFPFSRPPKKQHWKSLEIDFFDSQKGQKWTLKTAKMSKFLTLIFNIRGHISTFRTENTTKSGPFKAEYNAQTTSEQVLNNFEKVQNTTFLTPKMAKTRMSTWPKVSIFRSIFALRALFYACWSWIKNLNRSPDN